MKLRFSELRQVGRGEDQNAVKFLEDPCLLLFRSSAPQTRGGYQGPPFMEFLHREIGRGEPELV